MNNNFVLKKVSRILIFLFLIISCEEKKEAFLCYNPDYYFVYNEEYKIYKSVKKKLYRNFYQVKEVNVESFNTLPDTFKKVLDNKKSGFFYINDFLTPLLLKDELLSTNGNFKLLTYNLPMIEIDKNNISIFNIKIDPNIIKKKLLNFLKRFSKKKDFSDCGILVNLNYSFPFDLISSIKNDNLKLNILEIDKYDEKIIKNWLNENNMNTVLLFGYEINNFVSNLNEKEYQDLVFLEFDTRYGEIYNKIKYNIKIDWKSAVKYALESEEMKKFLKNKTKISKKDYLIKNKSVIIIEKYKNIKN